MVMFMLKYFLYFKSLDESSMVTTTSSGGPMIATIIGLNRSLVSAYVGLIISFFIH